MALKIYSHRDKLFPSLALFNDQKLLFRRGSCKNDTFLFDDFIPIIVGQLWNSFTVYNVIAEILNNEFGSLLVSLLNSTDVARCHTSSHTILSVQILANVWMLLNQSNLLGNCRRC